MGSTYLIYADDSGDETSSFYTGLLIPMAAWSAAMSEWLKFRQWMYTKYKVPADFEWHTYQWLRGAGEPVPDEPMNLINHSQGLRQEIAEKAMKQVGGLKRYGAGLVTCEVEGAVKAEAYAAMILEVDRQLAKQDAFGVIVVDGGVDGAPDPHVRAAHRDLDFRNRRVVEDGWLQPARTNQLVQVADLVVHSAYQAARKKPKREYMWSWYHTYLHALEWECRCP